MSISKKIAKFFRTIVIAGDDDIIADTADDSIEIIAGTNITLNSDNTAKTLTINSSGGGGGGIQFAWKFDTGTTPTPASGDIRFDNATPASVTNLYVSETSDGGADLATVLALVSTGQKIYVQQEDDSTKFILVEVSGTPTDNGTDWTIPVTVDDSGTLPDNNAVCRIIIVGASGGVSTFAALTDTNMTGLAEGDTLRYDISAGEWVNDNQVQIGDNSVSIIPGSPTASMFSFVHDHQADNLVTNPKFQGSSFAGWADVLTPAKTFLGTGQLVGDTNLQIDTNVTKEGISFAVTGLTELTDYIFSVHMRGDTGDEFVSIGVVLPISADVSTLGILSFDIDAPMTTEWGRLHVPFTTTTGETTCILQILSETGTAQTFFVDAIQLEAKPAPENLDIAPFPSSYLDGDMGISYSWAGSANASISSRAAGAHFIKPSDTSKWGGSFTIREDGSLGPFIADAGIIQSGAPTQDASRFGYIFSGDVKTNSTVSGTGAGVVHIINNTDGTAARVTSDSTTSNAFEVVAESVTTGSCMTVYSPEDMTGMLGSGGRLFQFAGKGENLEIYQWLVDEVRLSNLTFTFNKKVKHGGGGTSNDVFGATLGNVGVTNASATVTGTGFNTNFKNGDAIQIFNGGVTYLKYTIANVNSDTSLTLARNFAGTTNASRAHFKATRQYSPAVYGLEGAYGSHGAGTHDGDFYYGIYPSGGNGHLRVLKSSSRNAVTMPTADNQGSSLVTGRQVDVADKIIFLSSAETAMVTGYTIPAYELQTGNVIRIKFNGSLTCNATTTTITWRIKLGGTTIYTPTAVQGGSTSAQIISGEIMIAGTSLTTQRVLIDIAGQVTATATPGRVYTLSGYGTGAIDMRQSRTLSVTAQMSDAASALIVNFSTVEIL